MTCSPEGFPNVLTDSDDHSVNLFQPSVTIDKTGDTLSKVGDSVAYKITVDNTSSADSPDLICDVSDTLLGTLDQDVRLEPGEDLEINRNRTVLAGDPDPLPNTATVTCQVDGFSNMVSDSDDHSVNLFQPSVTLDKTGDTLSKVGDSVAYKITVDNTSSADSPDLICDVSDTLLGTLDQDVRLAPGGDLEINRNRTVLASDPDPLPNTATVTCSPEGFPNVLTDSDDHSVNLFQPSVAINKTGDTLSKVGDPVAYKITVDNTSSADSPDLICDVSDTLLGTLDQDVRLEPGEDLEINRTRTVQAGDPDPLENTATVTCSPEGFPNVLTASDSHSVNLFQPGVRVDKTGPSTAQPGQTVTYTYTITNTGSADSPSLILDSVTDDKVGNLTAIAAANGCSTLSTPGGTCTFTASFTIPAAASNPFVNTVTVHYHPNGFPNDIKDDDDHSVGVIRPSVSIDKTGDTLSKVGDPVNYKITVTNTSSSNSPDLTCDVSDSLLGTLDQDISLDPGETHEINRSRTVQSGDPDPLSNTATVTCQVDGLSTTVTASDSHTVNLFQPSVLVNKTGPAEATAGQTITYTYTISNTGSSDSPSLILDSVVDNRVGSLTAAATAAGCGTLVTPSGTCTFTANFTVPSGSSSPLVNVVTVHYHPNGFPNDIADNDDHSVVIKAPPAGKGCTPGFWKNHPNAWPPTGFSRTQTLESVFDVPDAAGLDNKTLLEALSFNGGNGTLGAARILLRAGVAALLNAAHPSIDYPRSPASVIADVNAALASLNRNTMIALAGQLDRDNNLGCPINGK